MEESIILEVSGLSKSFGPTRAVTDMHFTLHAGEIRGLIGENGSGKSTVTSMIAGCLHRDSGTMRLNGKPYAPHSMLEGRASGVCMLLQEKGTINHLTVAENVFLGKEKQFSKLGVVNRARMNQEAKKVLERIDLNDVDPAESIDRLSFEDRKLVEAGMAMKEDPQLLIVDETTTALSQKGRDVIYRIMNEMRAEKKCVIFISHDLDELKAVCDSVTVMRDGAYVTTLYGEEITVDAMRRNMIGRDLTGKYYRSDYDRSYDETQVMLDVENISLGTTLSGVSLQLHKGEILGIGGLTDCGMHDLCKVIFGLISPDSGTVRLPKRNAEIHNSVEAAQNGMGYVPKDRELDGLMMAASIRDNVTLMSMDRLERAGLVVPTATKKAAEAQVKALSIKIGGLEYPVSSLSGGNKQKVAIAKCLANDVDILIMDCPTRGIDIGVKASIYRLLEQLKAEGRAVLMVSEEMPELIGMSDNLIIMKDGKITARIPRSPSVTEHDVISKMI